MRRVWPFRLRALLPLRWLQAKGRKRRIWRRQESESTGIWRMGSFSEEYKTVQSVAYKRCI